MNKKKRLTRILLCCLVAAISIYLIYFIFRMPSFSPEMAMRRQEAKHMVGPSKIIVDEELMVGGYERFLLGETAYGYCMFEYPDRVRWWDSGGLIYIEKAEKAAFHCNSVTLWGHGDVIEVPVFVFPESNLAETAKLTLTAEHNGNQYEVTQTVPLEHNTYFFFKMDASKTTSTVRTFWYEWINGRNYLLGYLNGTLMLELYDRQGTLIDTVYREYSYIK